MRRGSAGRQKPPATSASRSGASIFSHAPNARGNHDCGQHRRKVADLSASITVRPRRIGDFISTHPEVDVEVQSTGRLADVKGGEVDVALRFGRGGYAGVHCDVDR